MELFSPKEIAGLLNAQGITTRYGVKWDFRSVSNFLSRWLASAEYGRISAVRRQKEKDVQNAKYDRVLKLWWEGLRYEEIAEVLRDKSVDPAPFARWTWKSVQKIVLARTSPSEREAQKHKRFMRLGNIVNEMRNKGMMCKAIAAELNDRRIPNRSGGKGTIASVFETSAYAAHHS